VFGVQPSGCKLNLELRSNPKQSLIFVPDSCISFFASVAKSGRALPTFLFWGSGMARPDGVDVDSLRTRITALAEKVAAAMGMDVILVEIKVGSGRSIVRTFVDQPGGISLGDCERFSRRFSVVLDVEDWIPFSYILEVSSPGLDRPLVKEKDFERFAGKTARVRTRVPLEGQRNFKGKLLGVFEGRVGLEIGAGRKIEIGVADIEKANLVFEN